MSFGPGRQEWFKIPALLLLLCDLDKVVPVGTSEPPVLCVSSLIQPPVMPPSWAKLLSLAFQPLPGFSCHLLFSLPSNSLLPFQLGLLTGPRTPCFLAFLPLLGVFPSLGMPLAFGYPEFPHLSSSKPSLLWEAASDLPSSVLDWPFPSQCSGPAVLFWPAWSGGRKWSPTCPFRAQNQGGRASLWVGLGKT